MKVELAAAGEAQAPGGSDLPHIVFDGVRKHYPGARGPVQALEALSLEIMRGEAFGIIGRSGAGKSTLLRTVNALERPSEGRVLVDGIDVAALDEDGLVLLRRRIGMVFQHFNLLSSRTVYENVALPLRAAGWRPAIVRARVDELLALVGLTDKMDAYPAQLSGGQKQRVGIARALVHEPEILLCDEATSALDPETTQSILELLRELHRKLGLTIVLITHDMAVIREVCDRVLVLDQGRKQESGEVWQVFAAPRSEAARALLRPLQHAASADLLLQAGPGAGDALAVLAIDWADAHGQQGLALARLQVLGPRARLLHGGLDRIRGHAQGRLLVGVPVEDLPSPPTPAALAYLQQALGADQLRLLGHVPASAR
ncbi:Methionine import ATP-binding protein MetN [Delftia tsuruhatensis]|uniref:methionine ABC transporter ATP-binding protein n=1 Tax=Delftia tsuruhatensis TaxID=180282 RepID=UPI001E811528|nr:methionine ABC transporter ATP-binding protein [Delftia tsuruhatensis]CAB5664076.1 Methionine import ATP-binding protein MetN [Delftia tsuruhatensis]CAC9677384.1 Methionine import ATP-binding protein MetN [Delftia tsuruhatensis]